MKKRTWKKGITVKTVAVATAIAAAIGVIVYKVRH